VLEGIMCQTLSSAPAARDGSWPSRSWSPTRPSGT
jgi:hypothetical protein